MTGRRGVSVQGSQDPGRNGVWVFAVSAGKSWVLPTLFPSVNLSCYKTTKAKPGHQ